MPVDNIGQGGMPPARPASSGTVSTSAAGPTQRQSLPGSGQNVPAAVAGAPPRALDDAVRDLNDYVQTLRRDLQFSVDADSGRTVVRVVDSESGETIRQIPSEEVLAIAQSLEQVQGLILSAKV